MSKPVTTLPEEINRILTDRYQATHGRQPRGYGLYVFETVSVILQVASFRMFGKRIEVVDVSRLGSDRFDLVLCMELFDHLPDLDAALASAKSDFDLTDEADIASVAERFISYVEKPVTIAGKTFRPQGSFGISRFPDDGIDVLTPYPMDLV